MISRKNKLPKSDWGKTRTSKFTKTEVETTEEKKTRMTKFKKESNREYLEAKARKKSMPMKPLLKYKAK